ncbi:MAG TPA: hypothetical protein VK968_03185 [Roseimicrobium sp.]|nr:hypothetical protein [Roseimicrobium sp.]
MKLSTIHPTRTLLSGAMLVLLVGIGADPSPCAAQQPPPQNANARDAEVMTRGPVHEAFAGVVAFNPEPGVIVKKSPPELIEEMPPEEKPEGNNVTWIPGYWAWDDERTDFLWISGTWRALPPGREWMAGYWSETARGNQWISGYWADAAVRVTTYLPPPPQTLEEGPNTAAPSIDFGWSPGCWIWYSGRYAWRPGYWAQGRADWDWTPDHYVWTPRGYIFIGGFWDYPVERRGILFAPVYFESGWHSRRGSYYSPSIVIDLGVFSDHLFLRPSYSHYYFGDYYAQSYVQFGFHASFSFQSSRYGYDPIYSHQRWDHRRDRGWEPAVAVNYQYRRDHETARPPRTYEAQKSMKPGSSDPREGHRTVATPIAQISTRKESPVRLKSVPKEERERLTQRGQEVQRSRDDRRTVENKIVSTPTPTPTIRKSGSYDPSQVQLPRSPIVSQPVERPGRDEAPPKAQKAPKPDLKAQPRQAAPERQPEVDRGSSRPGPASPGPDRGGKPGGNGKDKNSRDKD